MKEDKKPTDGACVSVCEVEVIEDVVLAGPAIACQYKREGRERDEQKCL